eukprot:TRINITY_DN8768_c0_g1_i3.p1 TRINITY_DN8768_c0_g1~~TRINITY_DN8768_c0_g1_i3.p1  ORF type:complete len:245 (-),score=54.07 TRINITY_DN8768_c0_g1_i3:58-792(-)
MGEILSKLTAESQVERIHGMLSEAREEAEDVKHGRQAVNVKGAGEEMPKDMPAGSSNSASKEVRAELVAKEEQSHRTRRKRKRKGKHGAKHTGEQREYDDESEDEEEEDEEEENSEEESEEDTVLSSRVEGEEYLNLVDRLFATYASRSRGHDARLLQKARLSTFASDLREAAPTAHSWYKSNWPIIEVIFDDTEDLQHSMSHPDARPAAGLALEWFRVFAQKVVGRLGPEFMGCFEVILSSRA